MSVTDAGEEAKGASGRPAISEDGQFVVFVSDAANLVPEDTNESQDVFVRDRLKGRTELVSVSSLGRRGDGDSGWYPSISGDGRFVVFVSSATTLTEGDEKRDIDVEGGQTLLSYLSDNDVNISSSCGGKGSCGYCKVRLLSGGGPVLPTEEIYMSRQEMQDGIRLACQVKVKNDLEISIPDFLTIVKQMVASQKFDAKKNWLVTIK